MAESGRNAQGVRQRSCCPTSWFGGPGQGRVAAPPRLALTQRTLVEGAAGRSSWGSGRLHAWPFRAERPTPGGLTQPIRAGGQVLRMSIVTGLRRVWWVRLGEHPERMRAPAAAVLGLGPTPFPAFPPKIRIFSSHGPRPPRRTLRPWLTQPKSPSTSTTHR